MIKLERFSATYLSNGRRAVGPLSLSVRKGERLALLGPSGCGKTTVLRAILGLLPPREAALEGAILRDGAAISAVFQRPALFPWLTVRANVAFPLAAAGRAAEDEGGMITTPLLRMGGLAGWESALPGQLSAGMQQRVSFLRALAAAPDLILMDEPFSSLDVAAKEKLMTDFLALLEARGTTLLFVTHDIGEALRMGTRVLLLTHGPAAEKSSWQVSGLDAPGLAGLRAELEAGYEA